MSVLSKLATYKGHNDDVINIKLAKEIASKNDNKQIEELVENLNSSDSNIASDCIKVLYEIGYLNPKLISKYADDFLCLLESKNNRLVWGGMIALQAITLLSPTQIWGKREKIIRLYNDGSVITKDNAIKILAKLSSIKPDYEKTLFNLLLDYLTNVREQSVPMYAEAVLITVNKNNKKGYINVLNKRMKDIKKSGQTRIQKLLKKVEKL